MSHNHTLPRFDCTRFYRALDRQSFFKFGFVSNGDYISIYCLEHPPLHGCDDDPNKTHLLNNRKLCFTTGREPRTQARAEELAMKWAEYLVEYRKTGVPQH
jgi:hypothetical protein